MDATRKKRTRDRARQAWYALSRRRRFARFLGYGTGGPTLRPVSRDLIQDVQLSSFRADLCCH
jgi:hypothetical protein